VKKKPRWGNPTRLFSCVASSGSCMQNPREVYFLPRRDGLGRAARFNFLDGAQRATARAQALCAQHKEGQHEHRQKTETFQNTQHFNPDDGTLLPVIICGFQ
jgi:hypothetical protein